ncbi:MAG: hypothetical protein RIS47_1577 [Bacteroidota bacterium]|jgi:hypothetical protein
MNKTILLLALILSIASHTVAQNSLVCINQHTQELKYIYPDNQLVVQFSGYLGQAETRSGNLTSLTDSSLTISYRKSLFHHRQTLEIRTRDITALSRISPGRMLWQSFSKLGITLGSLWGITRVSESQALTQNQSIGINIGISLSTNLLLAHAYNPKARLKTAEGWRFMSSK